MCNFYFTNIFLTHLIKMGEAGRVINLRKQNIILTNKLQSVINVYFYLNPLFLYALKYTLTALTVGQISVILTSH